MDQGSARIGLSSDGQALELFQFADEKMAVDDILRIRGLGEGADWVFCPGFLKSVLKN